MKQASYSIMDGVLQAGVSGRAAKLRRSWMRVLLDALHESRRRQANRIIRDHAYLLAKPEHIANFVRSTREDPSDVER